MGRRVEFVDSVIIFFSGPDRPDVVGCPTDCWCLPRQINPSFKATLKHQSLLAPPKQCDRWFDAVHRTISYVIKSPIIFESTKGLSGFPHSQKITVDLFRDNKMPRNREQVPHPVSGGENKCLLLDRLAEDMDWGVECGQRNVFSLHLFLVVIFLGAPAGVV